MNKYFKTKKYDKLFLKENMMGPNSMLILEELVDGLPLKPGMKVLDLGCGKGLTSVFLAKEFGVQVFAVDLWITATDNFKRFRDMGVEDLVIPIHADALNLPFANEYFDAVISVDSYHYFGSNDSYFKEKLRPFLKKDALVAIAFPGIKYEVNDEIPEDMRPFWDEEIVRTFHSINWWSAKFKNMLKNFTIKEMECFNEAWQDWLSSDNPYAEEDRQMVEVDNGRYMNAIALTGRVKKLDIKVRNEEPKDYRRVEEIAREAFWNLYFPGAHEHYVVHKMRSHPDFIKELAFVIEVDGKIEGAIFYTHSKIVSKDNTEFKTISFGPVFISPEYHRKGVGRELITHSIKIAKEMGYRAIITLGYPYHYEPYGFLGGKKYNISMEYGKFYKGLLVLPLYEGALDDIAGYVALSEILDVTDEEVDEFDKAFPFKEKRFQESQEEYELACAMLDE